MIIQGITVQSVTVASSAATVSTDSYFNLVSLLLPGNGTNGAQNNTFLDSSTNAFTVTRNGNTTQGTFSPFSQTGWSNYFDGTGDYLSTGLNAAFDFGSGAFTIEGWVNISSFPAGGATTYGLTTVYATGDADVGSDVRVFISKGSTLGGYSDGVIFASNSTVIAQSGSFTFNANQWYHIAVTRSSNSIYIFIDGVLKSTTSYSSTLPTATTYGPSIGATLYRGSSLYNMTGYISNLRVLKGTAQYTATFTPPTSPLTNIANTSLLTCQSNRFIDNSTNAFAITVSGNPSVQAFAPFNPTAAYDASTVGGSGYFDGTGDYLSIATNTALDFGSSDFTAECWIYPISFNSVDGSFMGVGAQAGSASWVLGGVNTGALYFAFWSGGTTVSTIINTSSNAIKLYSWNHVALTRNGSSFNIWANGVSVGTATDANAIGNTGRPAYICYGYGDNAGRTSNCYISSVRWVKGSAVYTAAFTPPTAPLTAIANTSLLLNYTNAGITDATAKNVLETVADAKISTAQSKWGGSSMYFDGSGDYLVTPAQAITSLTGDFTVEFWAYRPSAGNNFFYTTGDDALSSGIAIYIGNSGNNLRVYNANGVVIDAALSGISFPTATWTHIALVRSSGVVKLFVAGSQAGSNWSSSTTFSGKVYLATEFNNGSAGGTGNCYLQDFRITNGYARYTANFTPPTTAFPIQ